MSIPDLAPLATLLADRWAEARLAPVAVRLTLPHLILLASHPRVTAASLGRLANHLLADGLLGDTQGTVPPLASAAAMQEHIGALTTALRETRSAPRPRCSRRGRSPQPRSTRAATGWRTAWTGRAVHGCRRSGESTRSSQ